MKTIKILLISFIMIFLLSSCSKQLRHNDNSRIYKSPQEYLDSMFNYTDTSDNYVKSKQAETIQIGECEYYVVYTDNGSISFVHKGDCKFCQERMRLMIQNEIKNNNTGGW